MGFTTITNWETTEWTAEMEAMAQDKYVPLVMSVGAKSVQMVRTGDLSLSVITSYADAATSEAVQAKTAEIRGQAAQDLPMKMVSSASGVVFGQS